MISLILKSTNFKVLSVPFSKSEVFKSQISNVFQRTLCTSNVLLVRNIHKKELAEQDYQFSSENESEFGRVIELEEDFDELRIKKKEKGEKKLGKKFDVKKQKKNVEDDNENQQQNVQDSDFNKRNKFKSRLSIYNENCGTFRSVMMNLKSKKIREKNQEIILEGKRLIQDALSAGCKPKKIFYSRTEDIEKLELPNNVETVKVSYKSIGLWSDVVTSQGVVGVFRMPKVSTSESIPHSLPLTVVCDNVRDPGNLGSILRVTAGVGIKKMILTKGCVDLWEPKVLRAGAGAHFRLPVINNILWSNVNKEISENSKVILADSYDENDTSDKSFKNEKTMENNFRRKSEVSASLPIQCYYSLQYKDEDTVLIIGGETHGVSDEAYNFALEHSGTRIFIPMHNKIESLNNAVALGVLVYEFRRQLDLMRTREN